MSRGRTLQKRGTASARALTHGIPEGKQGGQCGIDVCVGGQGGKWLGDKIRGNKEPVVGYRKGFRFYSAMNLKIVLILPHLYVLRPPHSQTFSPVTPGLLLDGCYFNFLGQNEVSFTGGTVYSFIKK